ncbi:MAG: hypothetical protein QOJ81_1611 [Chloroflexota bacterium]|nr:hypothetical protein [Chloroflexota bacterium]
MGRRNIRLGLTLAVVLAASLIGAQPAAALYVASQTGTTGAYLILDGPYPQQSGFVCKYGPKVDNGYGYLHREVESIKIRAFKVWGYYSSKTWVGWQFKVIDDVPGSPVTYTSPTYKAKANNVTPAAFGNVLIGGASVGSNPYVKLFLYFYKPGSSTNWSGPGGGKVVAEPEWHDLMWNGVVHSQDYGICPWEADL